MRCWSVGKWSWPDSNSPSYLRNRHLVKTFVLARIRNRCEGAGHKKHEFAQYFCVRRVGVVFAAGSARTSLRCSRLLKGECQ